MELTITPNFAQERALNMLRRDWKANDTFMVYSPTGSGKTGLAAFIVAGFVSRGMRVLFCVPYTILIGQTANRFVQYGLPGDEIGYIWADHRTTIRTGKFRLPALIRLFVVFFLKISIC